MNFLDQIGHFPRRENRDTRCGQLAKPDREIGGALLLAQSNLVAFSILRRFCEAYRTEQTSS